MVSNQSQISEHGSKRLTYHIHLQEATASPSIYSPGTMRKGLHIMLKLPFECVSQGYRSIRKGRKKAHVVAMLCVEMFGVELNNITTTFSWPGVRGTKFSE